MAHFLVDYSYKTNTQDISLCFRSTSGNNLHRNKVFPYRHAVTHHENIV